MSGMPAARLFDFTTGGWIVDGSPTVLIEGMLAARQGDLTTGGPIVQGSPTVLIGDAGAVACSVCPGKVRLVGNPVNPALGAKVLLGEEDLDFALPGPQGLVWQRQYSSYVNEEHGADCGVLGYGWKLGAEIWVQEQEQEPKQDSADNTKSADTKAKRPTDKNNASTASTNTNVQLFDAAGRCIDFGALQVGQQRYSESEDLWLMRGGAFEGLSSPARAPAQSQQLAWAQQKQWSHVPKAYRADAQCILAASGAGGSVWVFLPERAPTAATTANSPNNNPGQNSQRYSLRAIIDIFGRTQKFSYAQEGPEAGQLAEIEDGVGRRYRLSYERVRLAGPAQQMAGMTLGADSGLRLIAVSLTHNPQHSSEGVTAQAAQERWRQAPSEQKPWVLVGYRYNASGDLVEVTDRSAQVVRRFEYDSAHRMVMHQKRSGVEHRYVYEDSAQTPVGEQQRQAQGHVLRPGARVIEQNNAQGQPGKDGQEADPGELSYRFDYLASQNAPGNSHGKTSAVRVTDSLGRISLYHFEGEGGLKRLASLTHADGSVESWGYDGAGRTTRHTDELGRSIYWRFDGRGRLLGAQQPDGRSSSQSWGEAGSELDGLITSSTDPAGRTSAFEYDRWGRLLEMRVGNSDGAASTRWRYAEPASAKNNGNNGNNTTHKTNNTPELAWIEHPIEIIDAAGGAKQLGYDGCGQLSSYTDCSGQRSSWVYNVWGTLHSVTDAQGHKTEHWTDAQGRVITTREADGREQRYSYDPAGHLHTIEQGQEGNSERSTVVLHHNPRGQLLRREHGGLGISFAYDRAGRLTTLQNENAAQTGFEYDSRDRLVQETGFDGRTQRNQFDAAGQVIEQWDGIEGQGWVRSRYHHDTGGRLVTRLAQKTPAGLSAAALKAQDNSHPIEVQSFEYDKGGALTAVSQWRLSGAAIPAELKALLQETQDHKKHNTAQGKEQDKEPQDWMALDSAAFDALWKASQDKPWLQAQSAAQLSRDSLGRLIEERQSLSHPSTGAPQHQHRIHHTLGALGQRNSSELQSLGAIHWQSYGSGHVHGLLLGQQSLIDIERDGLHREIGRKLHVLNETLNEQSAASTESIASTRNTESTAIQQQRQLDPQGRLLSQSLQGPRLSSGAQTSQGQLSQAMPLIGGVMERQYRFDALGQLIAVQSPSQNLLGGHKSPAQRQSYRYDPAQRLIAAAHSQLNPGQAQPSNQVHNWRLDPAGNRLPLVNESLSKGSSYNSGQNNASQQADWSAQVQRQLHNPEFDLLEGRAGEPGSNTSVDAWKDNRIALHKGVKYRFDAHGNRVHALHPDGTEEHYRYNALHQLEEHQKTQTVGEEGLKQKVTTTTSYRYDPFGRRLSKSKTTGKSSNKNSDPSTSQDTQTTYYGWDGDRLVHAESEEDIRHTVYEAGSFLPMVQLTRKKGAKNLLQLTLGEQALSMIPAQHHHALQEALASGFKASDKNSANNGNNGNNKNNKNSSNPVQQGLSASQNWGESMNALALKAQATVKAAQEAEEAQYPIDVKHIVCDHLGTPIALIDASGEHAGEITWAARYGAWGNIEAEFNPQQIEQPIRFQGQQLDEETGLHYNRFRYYDPVIGGYVTQDPIGLAGGANMQIYAHGQPVMLIDPIGLDNPGMGPYEASKQTNKSSIAKAISDFQTKPREDGLPVGAGCGDSTTDNVVPDKPMGYDFLPACKGHDSCYGNKSGPSKAACDMEFKKKMEEQCEKSNWLSKKYCKAIANDYYTAVDRYGGDAFKNGRK